MLHAAFAHLRAQWAGFLALFLVLASGTAYAANTVFSTDIVDGQVTTADLATDAVTTYKLRNGAVHTQDLDDAAVTGGKVLDDSLSSADLAPSSVASSEIANGSVTGTDIASHAVGQNDIDGTDHYGNIGVGGITNGQCITVTISIGGAEAGDAGILTTDGPMPDGEVMYLQRVLADSAQIKVCNLSGGSLPSLTVPVRVLTFH